MGSLLELILGDICGSQYEFKKNSVNLDIRVYDALMSKSSRFTDDTVMACAVAEAITNVSKDADEYTIKNAVIDSMKVFGRKYPTGYGRMMKEWIFSDSRDPYNSWGNGSAMRVYEVGQRYDSLERTLEVAQWTSEVTHNHPEAIAAARAVAGAIYLARTGASKIDIKAFVEKELDDELVDYEGMIFMYPYSKMDMAAKITVMVALDCFLNSDPGVIPVIESAINRGGDTDTIAAIAGGIAGAFYKGLESESYYRIILERIPEELADIAQGLNKKEQE